MSFIDELAEMKRLAECIYEGGVEFVNKYRDDTPHEEVVRELTAWIDSGFIVTRTSQGDRTQVANAIKGGYLFPSSFAEILVTQKEVRDKLERYIDAGRIMNVSRLAVRKGLITQHSIEKAVRNGEIVAVKSLGTAITLYVD